jgi:hypothetical protein
MVASAMASASACERHLRDRHMRGPDLAVDHGADSTAMRQPVVIALHAPRLAEAIDLARWRLDQAEAKVDEGARIAVLIELDNRDLAVRKVEVDRAGTSALVCTERHAAQGEDRGPGLHLTPPGRTWR